MTGSLPHRSHAHLTTPYSRHATANFQLICLLSAGAAHLTLAVWGGRLTSYLYSAHKSDFKFRTPDAWHRHFSLTKKLHLSLTGCLRVLYILDTCRLQVTKVTNGALYVSQSEEAHNSIRLARPEHLFQGSFYSKFLYHYIAPLKGTPGPPEILYPE